MSIVNALNTTIYSKLTGGTALTALLAGTTSIYYQQAPDNATMPYVVFSHQAGGPENINPSDIRQQLVYVRSYATNQALAGSIDAQCSTLLHKQNWNVSGYTNFWAAREEDLFPPPQQLPNNEFVYSAGGLYRVRFTA